MTNAARKKGRHLFPVQRKATIAFLVASKASVLLSRWTETPVARLCAHSRRGWKRRPKVTPVDTLAAYSTNGLQKEERSPSIQRDG
jgi:hypothetical protein